MADSKFPRDLRFTLGERVERHTLLVLQSLIRARYERDRVPRSDEANVELEVCCSCCGSPTTCGRCP